MVGDGVGEKVSKVSSSFVNHGTPVAYREKPSCRWVSRRCLEVSAKPENEEPTCAVMRARSLYRIPRYRIPREMGAGSAPTAPRRLGSVRVSRGASSRRRPPPSPQGRGVWREAWWESRKISIGNSNGNISQACVKAWRGATEAKALWLRGRCGNSLSCALTFENEALATVCVRLLSSTTDSE